ncbi:MAG: hypothetical protein ABIK37_00900 [candidate division WOR-3 bacterium]
MLSRFGLALVAATGAVLAAPPPVPVMPYDSLMDERVVVDGYVDLEDDEYPASFANAATGITVYWGFDDSLMYVAMTGKGKGWMAMGLGSARMNEANMIIGYYADDSAEVFNHVGAGWTHKAVPDSAGLLEDGDVDFDDETGTMTVEFIYPLRWSGLKGVAVSGLDPGDTYDLILARNAKTVSLAQKHGQKAALKFRMAPRPLKQEPVQEGN